MKKNLLMFKKDRKVLAHFPVRFMCLAHIRGFLP